MANSDWYSPNDSYVLDEEDKTNNDSSIDDVTSLFPALVANCSLPSPPDWTGGGTTAEEAGVRIATAVVCALYLVFGLVCIFFGYR